MSHCAAALSIYRRSTFWLNGSEMEKIEISCRFRGFLISRSIQLDDHCSSSSQQSREPIKKKQYQPITVIDLTRPKLCGGWPFSFIRSLALRWNREMNERQLLLVYIVAEY